MAAFGLIQGHAARCCEQSNNICGFVIVREILD